MEFTTVSYHEIHEVKIPMRINIQFYQGQVRRYGNWNLEQAKKQAIRLHMMHMRMEVQFSLSILTIVANRA